jgi:hypothetical protein
MYYRLLYLPKKVSITSSPIFLDMCRLFISVAIDVTVRGQCSFGVVEGYFVFA